MKKKFFTILICSIFLVPKDAGAAEIAATSKITHVTVYQDRALVTRSTEVNLEKGEQTIVFENLPSTLMEESLRAEGQGTAPVTFYGAEIKKFFGPEEVNPDVARITAELEKLRYELEELERKSQALADQKEFLNSIRSFSSVQIPKEIVTKSSPPSDWTSLAQYLLDAYTENSLKNLEAEKSITEKNKEIEAKQRELDTIGLSRNIEKKTVIVTVEAKDKTVLKLDLSYVVPQAAWTIAYDAKVSPEKKSCDLTSYGNIRQWTGEDWENTRLVLSSAKPAIGGRMPELDPWYVDFIQTIPMEYPRQTSSSKMMMRASAAAQAYEGIGGALESAEAPMQDTKLAEAAVSQELGSVTFEIAKPTTVMSDNRQYKTPLKSESFPLELDYETTPKVSPYAFIHSKVTNDKDYSLMSGELNIFVNDSFIGKSWIKTIGQNETFDLYLGIDEEIKVKRIALIDKMKKALLGLRARKDYGYKIELENYKKQNVKVTVIDQLPVSKNAEIKTELVSASVKPMKTEDLGVVKWSFDLAPKEKKSFEFQFFVEYPSDKNVLGV